MRQGSPAAAKSLSTWWSRSRSISRSPPAGIDEIRTGILRIDETVSSIGGISGLVESINASCCEISGRIKNDELINILINEQAGVIRENAEMIKAAMNEQKNAIDEVVISI